MSLALLRLTQGLVDTKQIVIPSAPENLNARDWTALEVKTQALWSKTLVEQWRAAKSPFALSS